MPRQVVSTVRRNLGFEISTSGHEAGELILSNSHDHDNNSPGSDHDDKDPKLDIVEHHHDNHRYVINDDIVAIVR